MVLVPIKGELDINVFQNSFNYLVLRHPLLRTRFITEGGGVVQKELSTKTHYLIAGDNSKEALEEASKYGITILSEDQLIDFIRPKQISR